MNLEKIILESILIGMKVGAIVGLVGVYGLYTGKIKVIKKDDINNYKISNLLENKKLY